MKVLRQQRIGIKGVVDWRRLVKIFWGLLNGLWAIPLVVVFRLLQPLVLFRFGTIRSDRIGHFVTDSAEQKARLQVRDGKRLDFYWLPTRTANQQWLRMIQREMPVLNCTRHIDDWNRRLPGGERHSRPSTYSESRDKEGLYYRYDCGFDFTVEEDRMCRSWLSSIGWSDGELVVCVLVRDSVYLAEDQITTRYDKVSKDRWSYHDYRDSNIFNYLPALTWLADQGVWVFRMGKLMEKPLNAGHPRIIDYAFSTRRSDLLDVWLFANCSFCISTSTGPDSIATVYRRPILYLNASPLGHLTTYSNSLWAPKNLFWIDDDSPLRLKDYLTHTYFHSQKYHDAGLRFQELTQEEIVEFVQEFWDRQHQTWQSSEEDLTLQHKFWGVLRGWDGYQNWHGWCHPNAGAATSWLRRQRKDFFD